MQKLNVCIDGSLGKGNLGDNNLFHAFHCEHESDFGKKFLMRAEETSDWVSNITKNWLPLPQLCGGWRSIKFRGSRRRVRDVWLQEAGANSVYLLLGGLLGHLAHVDIRAQLLKMASSVDWKRCYYFGDIESFCEKSRPLQRVLDRLSGPDTWVSVRSEEAANLLTDRGYRQQVHIGIDPVLYQRTKCSPAPFVRSEPSNGAVALIPSDSVFRSPIAFEWWVDVAKEVKASGREILWCIFDSQHDVNAAKAIAIAAGFSEDEFEVQLRFEDQAIVCSERAFACFTDRYHGAIFPMTRGVPTIARGWNDKIVRLFRLLGLEDWCMSSEARTPIQASQIRNWLREASSDSWAPNHNRFIAESERHTQSLLNFRSWVDAS